MCERHTCINFLANRPPETEVNSKNSPISSPSEGKVDDSHEICQCLEASRVWGTHRYDVELERLHEDGTWKTFNPLQ